MCGNWGLTVSGGNPLAEQADTRETAEERSRRFIEELDAVERMTPDDCRSELKKLANRGGMIGAVAEIALVRSRRPQRCWKEQRRLKWRRIAGA